MANEYISPMRLIKNVSNMMSVEFWSLVKHGRNMPFKSADGLNLLTTATTLGWEGHKRACYGDRAYLGNIVILEDNKRLHER